MCFVLEGPDSGNTVRLERNTFSFRKWILFIHVYFAFLLRDYKFISSNATCVL